MRCEDNKGSSRPLRCDEAPVSDGQQGAGGYTGEEWKRSRKPRACSTTDVIVRGLRSTELANEVQQRLPEVHVIYISGNAHRTCGKHRCRKAGRFYRSHFVWPLWPNSLNSCRRRSEATDFFLTRVWFECIGGGWCWW